MNPATDNALSPENLFVVLTYGRPPVLVAAHEGAEGSKHVGQAFPKARSFMDYPTLKKTVEDAAEAKIHEARPFLWKPTLHFCLTATRGAETQSLVVKAASVAKAVRKAKQVAFDGKGLVFVGVTGTLEELTHYLAQLDEALEQGKPIHLEQDLRGGMLVLDGTGQLPGELRELVGGMVEPGKPMGGMTPDQAIAYFKSVPETSGAGPGPALKNVDEAVAQLKGMELEDADGNTCLHLVGDYYWDPYSAAQVARRLLELGADPNARNHNGSTPLQGLAESIYCQGREVDGVEEDERALVKVLLDGGADPLMGRPGTPEEKTVMPVEVFPDLVEPWLTVAAMQASLPEPAAGRPRERL